MIVLMPHSPQYYIPMMPNMLHMWLVVVIEIFVADQEDERILRTELIIPRHGFASVWFGRRTRSFGRGGRRIAATLLDAPLGGIATG